MTDSGLDDIRARLAITDTLARYCRGLDRMDKNMAYAVWHPDATANYYDMFEGSGHGFIDWVWKIHAAVERHSHQIANTLVTIDGEKAVSEAYVTVCLWTRPDHDGKQWEVTSRGRYLDRWSQRGDRWAIQHRSHVQDMQTIRDLTRGQVNAQSTRDTRDVSFEFFDAG